MLQIRVAGQLEAAGRQGYHGAIVSFKWERDAGLPSRKQRLRGADGGGQVGVARDQHDGFSSSVVQQFEQLAGNRDIGLLLFMGAILQLNPREVESPWLPEGPEPDPTLVRADPSS